MSDPNNTLQIPSQTTNRNNADMPPPPIIEVPKIEPDTKKEKTMAEFLATMDNYAPIVRYS